MLVRMATTPDTKDWTWVLDRPCPECGFDSRTVAREDVAGLLRRNAAAWPAVPEQPAAARRPRPDKWAPLEQDPAVVAAELTEAAGHLASAFEQVSDWSRPGTRSDGAHFTIETLARYLVHDPVHTISGT
jgi:hypothetical protein